LAACPDPSIVEMFWVLSGVNLGEGKSD